MDNLQRKKLSPQECDVVYLAQDINTSINAVCKKRVGKNERAKLEEELEKEKKKARKQYWEDGGIIKNTKHREQPRNTTNILMINAQTTYDDYKGMLKERKNLLQEAFHKIKTPFPTRLRVIARTLRLHKPQSPRRLWKCTRRQSMMR